jgi:hypothetical protein
MPWCDPPGHTESSRGLGTRWKESRVYRPSVQAVPGAKVLLRHPVVPMIPYAVLSARIVPSVRSVVSHLRRRSRLNAETVLAG